MEQKQSDVPSEKQYNISFLLQSNEIKEYNMIYNDAFFQLLTSASAIRNASLSSFNTNDVVESTQKNFYYVIVNGYTVLRIGSEQIANDFYKFYDGLIQDYVVTFIILLTLAIFFLIIS